MLSAAELADYRAALEDTLPDTLDVLREAAGGFVGLNPGAPSESTALPAVPCRVKPLGADAQGNEVVIAGGARVIATSLVRVPVGTAIEPKTDTLSWNGRRLRVVRQQDRSDPLLDAYLCGEIR